MKLKHIFVPLFLISLYAYFVIFPLSLQPIFGDPAYHAHISKTISKTGELVDFDPYIIATKDINWPVFYPQIFHTMGAILYIIIGENSFSILPVFYGIFIAITLFTLVREYFGYVYSLISLIAVISNSWFIKYSTSYFMEIAVVFYLVACLNYLIKYVSIKDIRYAFLSSLFFGMSIATKQTAYIFLPIFMACILYVAFVDNNYKHAGLMVGVTFIISVAPLMYLFSVTGTIFYPGDLPSPIDKLQRDVANVLNIKVLKQSDDWSIYGSGSVRRKQELKTWRNVNNVILSLNPFNNLGLDTWGHIKLQPSYTYLWIFILLSAILLSIFNIYRMPAYTTIMYGSMLFFLISLSIFARPRYFLILFIIFPTAIVTEFVYYLSRIIDKRMHVFITSIITILLILSMASAYYSESIRNDRVYGGGIIQNASYYRIDAYNWIKNENNNYTIVGLTYDIAYYSEKPVIWINPLGAADIYEAFLNKNESNAIKVFSSYDVGYVLLDKYRIRKRAVWAGEIPMDGLVSIMDDSVYFKKVYENDIYIIYRVLY